MRTALIRMFLLVAVAGAGAGAAWFATRRPANGGEARVAWVATAHQYGPVGYRDPAGAISPDGTRIAYSEGRFLRVRPIDGGPIVELPPGPAQIRYLAWRPDSRAVVTDGDPSGSVVYDLDTRTRRALAMGTPALRQPVWAPDGKRVAALVNGREGNELWVLPADASGAVDRSRGERIRTIVGGASFPAWSTRGEIACIANVDGRPRVTLPCGGAVLRTDPDRDAYGPLAFSPDGAMVYVALANDAGTVDLWAVPVSGGRGRRVSAFSRDAYAPSLASDGSVVFKVQSYRTTVAVVPAGGGAASPLAVFQSETPSWDPTGQWLGITYGTWRRQTDDAKYPDIAQDAGIIAADASQPARAPARIVHDSASEDQSLCWSPNGRWIAFHSHKDQSDDIWLRPAQGTAPARRVSFLGRGAETGWPRWSPDGRWLLFDGAKKVAQDFSPAIFVAGIDQESGATTVEPRAISVTGLDADVSHAEWLPDSAHVAVIAKEGAGRHVIFTVARDGGAAHVVHRLESDHDAPGLAVSPDGRMVAFIAPATDGFFQVFRMPIGGGAAEQVTTDPTNKTQPAWSPDGTRIALTVWSYDVQFWRLPER